MENEEIKELENSLAEETSSEVENIEFSDVIKYKLESFEGPLDLLLHLIKEKKMAIMTKSEYQ